MSPSTTLVVGATGATGKFVVQYLLDHAKKDQIVKVICRDQAKMKSLLSGDYGDRLQITEASISKMSMDELKSITNDCSAVVSCLGHNISIEGMWGKDDRLFVSESTARLTSAMPSESKFILMGSEGVAAPGDDRRGFLDRVILHILRYLVPPHVDNEAASEYMWSRNNTKPEWVIVRPCDMQDGPTNQPYVIHPKPTGSLFGSGIVTRATVARFMVDLLTDPKKWDEYKFHAPVIHDVPQTKK